MSVQRDPNTGEGAKVNNEGQAVTRAIVESEIEHASGVLGTAYTWDSTELDIDAGDTMLFIKNNTDIPLILDTLDLNGSNVICTWTVLLGATTTTPTGTALVGKNCNTGRIAKVSDATAFSDETAVADGNIVKRYKTAISEHKELNLSGIIIEKNGYVQVNQITESTSGSAIITGHFEVIS